MLSEYMLMQDMSDQQKMLFTSKFQDEKFSSSTALLLCFFLGGLGVHKFYLGQTGWGIVYFLFCWTFIPALAALVECFLMSSRVKEMNEKKAVEIAMMVKALTGKPKQQVPLAA